MNWQIAFCGLREGLPEWEIFPDVRKAGLKWFRAKTHNPRPDERFWQKHYDDHREEADNEFTAKVILAPPREVPAEPKMWEALSDPQTDEKTVCSICVQSQVLRSVFGSPRFMTLYRYPREFRRAKKDKRYPTRGKQKRASSDEKRLVYLARVMAGLSLR